MTLYEDGFVAENFQFRNCAIVFIAHSLGGIIVKQVFVIVPMQKSQLTVVKCLTKALERPTDFKDVARSSTIFIAIATPHSRSDNPKEWNQMQLLAGSRGYGKRGQQATVEDAGRLADLCTRFEGVTTNVQIITMYETRETVIKSLLVWASRALVGRLRPRVNMSTQGTLTSAELDRTEGVLRDKVASREINYGQCEPP